MGGERGLGGALFWGVDTSVWGRENSVEQEGGVLVFFMCCLYVQ